MTGPRNSSPFLFLKPFSSNSRSSAFIDCHISVQAWGSKHVWENLHIKHQQLAQALSSYSDTALSTTQSFKLLQVPPVVFWLASALVIDCEWEAWNIRLQNSVLKLNLFFLYIKDFFFFFRAKQYSTCLQKGRVAWCCISTSFAKQHFSQAMGKTSISKKKWKSGKISMPRRIWAHVASGLQVPSPWATCTCGTFTMNTFANCYVQLQPCDDPLAKEI